MTWILVLLILYGNGTTSEQLGPFSSEKDCMRALEDIQKSVIGEKTRPVGYCIPIKGSVSPNKEFD